MNYKQLFDSYLADEQTYLKHHHKLWQIYSDNNSWESNSQSDFLTELNTVVNPGHKLLLNYLYAIQFESSISYFDTTYLTIAYDYDLIKDIKSILLANIPKGHVAKLLPPHTRTIYKELHSPSKITYDDTKSLALDNFAFSLFKGHLESISPITSKQALIYINSIEGRSWKQSNIKDNYKSIIFSAVTKPSIQLQKECESLHLADPEYIVCVSCYSKHKDNFLPVPSIVKHITFDHYSLITINETPISPTTVNVAPSTIHQWRTGFPKSKAPSPELIAITIDYINILNTEILSNNPPSDSLIVIFRDFIVSEIKPHIKQASVDYTPTFALTNKLIKG